MEELKQGCTIGLKVYLFSKIKKKKSVTHSILNYCSKLYKFSWPPALAISQLMEMKRVSKVNTTDFSKHFSNSLIIHQVKTKKITSVKEIWIPGLNKHRC